jgi:hypothetical protein
MLMFAAGAWAADLARILVGFDPLDEADGLVWLWQDLAWTGLLAALGLIRFLCRASPKRQLVDGLALACVAYRIILASGGLQAVEFACATAVAAAWAVLAWQTWRTSKLGALTLVPLGLMLAYGVAGSG